MYSFNNEKMPRTRSRGNDDFIVPDEYSDPDELVHKIQGDYIDDDECEDEYMQSPFLLDDWKNDVSDPLKYEHTLKELVQEQRDLVPTVQTIIDADISRSEKRECLYVLDRFKNMDPYNDTFQDTLKDLQKRLRTKSSTEKAALSMTSESVSYPDQILALDANDAIKTSLLRYANSIGETDDGDVHSKRTKLDGMLSLPYNRVTTQQPLLDACTQVRDAATLLEQELYGLESVKRMFLSVLASTLLGTSETPVIALIGPPGVGKTHISGLYSKVLGVKSYHILLGGAKDCTILNGGDNMWQGSSCGQIARALQTMGVSDGVIVFDEIDKSNHLDVYNSLNHILDYSSNSQFHDEHYSEVPLDLSRIKFVVTMNDASMLPEPLLDRMTVIRLDAYNHTDKQTIASQYLLPRFLPNATLHADAVRYLVKCTREAGVRDMKKFIQHISKKVDLHRLMYKDKSFAYTQLKKYSPNKQLTEQDVKVLVGDIIT